MGPVVSIIVPNYNHQQFLKQRIDSIINQSYKDFEVIILDDCSNDDSKKIIENYRNHIKVSHIIYNLKNSGSTFLQWQKGINVARGKYIWIAESDDWCEYNFLETLIYPLLSDDRYVIGFSQTYMIINDNEIKWKSDFNKLASDLTGIEFINTYMLSGNKICNASMAIFKKATLKNITKDYLQFKFCGDWLFWIEIAKQGNVFISGKYLNYFRKHDNDVSSKFYNNSENYLEEIKLLKIFLQYHFINEIEYRSLVLEKYTKFKSSSFLIEEKKGKEIKDAFYFIKDKSLKYFLLKNYFFYTLRKKSKYLIKKLLKY